VGYCHDLFTTTRWELKESAIDKDSRKLTLEDYFSVEEIQCTFEISFFIGGDIVTLSTNPYIGTSDALKDYVRKVAVIRNLFNVFLRDYKPYYEADKTFVLKEFLESSESHSAAFTSMVAIGRSTSDDYFFFDIASSDSKARLYESKEKHFLELATKMTKLLTVVILDAEEVLEKYKGRI